MLQVNTLVQNSIRVKLAYVRRLDLWTYIFITLNKGSIPPVTFMNNVIGQYKSSLFTNTIH